MKNKMHKKETLMGCSKDELAEYCIMLEYNNDVLKKQFEVQYSNCMKIIDDMNLINKIYKEVKRI